MIVQIKYQSRGTRFEAHSYRCTIRGYTISVLLSSKKCMYKNYSFYLNNNKGTIKEVPNISSYTEEQLFQLSLVHDEGLDFYIIHEIQKRMLDAYDAGLYQKFEFEMEEAE